MSSETNYINIPFFLIASPHCTSACCFPHLCKLLGRKAGGWKHFHCCVIVTDLIWLGQTCEQSEFLQGLTELCKQGISRWQHWQIGWWGRYFHDPLHCPFCFRGESVCHNDAVLALYMEYCWQAKQSHCLLALLCREQRLMRMTVLILAC